MFADGSSVVAKRSTCHRKQSIKFDLWSLHISVSQMNLALLISEPLVITSQSSEFEFGLHTFVFADESSVVATRSTGAPKSVY